MPKKTIILDSHHIHPRCPDEGHQWADVWVTYKARPGRSVTWAPTLLTRAAVESDLELARWFVEKHPEYDYSDEIAYCEQLLAALEEREYVLDLDHTPHRIPNIVTRAEEITPTEAERMIAHLLETLGYPRVRFRWKKPGPLFTIPV